MKPDIETLVLDEAASSKEYVLEIGSAGAAKKSPELKPLLLELHKAALNRAKAEGNLMVRTQLLARASVKIPARG